MAQGGMIFHIDWDRPARCPLQCEYPLFMNELGLPIYDYRLWRVEPSAAGRAGVDGMGSQDNGKSDDLPRPKYSALLSA